MRLRPLPTVVVLVLAVVVWIAVSTAQTPRAADPRFDALASLAGSLASESATRDLGTSLARGDIRQAAPVTYQMVDGVRKSIDCPAWTRARIRLALTSISGACTTAVSVMSTNVVRRPHGANTSFSRRVVPW